jgi:hypothetical protein
MKFSYCGLIISLSLFLLGNPAYSKTKKDNNPPPQAAAESTDTTAAQQNAQPAALPGVQPDQQAAPQPDQPAQQVAQPPAPVVPVPSQPDQNTVNLMRTVENMSMQLDYFKSQYLVLFDSITNQDTQLNDIKQQQDKILTSLKSLEDTTSKYSASQSTDTPSSDQINKILSDEGKMVGMINSLAEGLDKLRNDVRGNASRAGSSVYVSTGSSRTIVPSGVTMEDKGGQQYMKVKFNQDGQEVELFLDPTYVDMNIDLTKMKQQDTDKTSAKTQDKDKDAEAQKVADYLSKSIEEKNAKYANNQNGQSSPQQSSQQQNPQSDQNGNAQPGLPAGGNDPNGAVQAAPQQQETSPAIEQLYKAQKLFYGKKYNAALNSVQKSIATQPTGLGYALEGSIYFTMGDVDLAINSWEEALKLDPSMNEVKKALFKYKR